MFNLKALRHPLLCVLCGQQWVWTRNIGLDSGLCRNLGQMFWKCLWARSNFPYGHGKFIILFQQWTVIVLITKVHFILNELVMGGMVLETNMTEIMLRIEEQNKIEKEEVRCQFLVFMMYYDWGWLIRQQFPVLNSITC